MKDTGLKARSVWLAASMVAITLGASGCRTRKSDGASSAAAIQAGLVDTQQVSAKKVGGAAGSIVTACAKEPFANASKGLIVAETGLNEDVFDLRDHTTYRAVPFGLNEALRLQGLLLKEIDASGHARYQPEQIACIQQFAAHFKSLTDPLVEADAEQKQLDVSAFDKASQEAEQEAEQQINQEQKAITPASSKQN